MELKRPKRLLNRFIKSIYPYWKPKKIKYWPLSGINPTLPIGPGRFSSVRKYDIHTGVDLYCPDQTLIAAIEDGVVIKVLPFTGKQAGSPWWNDTDALMIEGESGVFVYGEITTNLKIGDKVTAGLIIGEVARVLKKDKGLAMTMLHLELYKAGTTDVVWWRLDEAKPRELEDPTFLLKSIGNIE